MIVTPFDIGVPPIPGWPPLASYAVYVLAGVSLYFAGKWASDKQAAWVSLGQALRQETADHKAEIDKKVAELVSDKTLKAEVRRIDEHLASQDRASDRLERNLIKLLVARGIQPDREDSDPPPRPKLPSQSE